ncbi:MAG TPA: ATP-dependent protease, partial [Anaerolineae bacterium]|nr:ATP-dependent protease [Anaerolineae bacterium]
MPIKPLSTDKLRRRCNPEQFDFATTAELDSVTGIFGQPRGVRALEFGVGIRSRGYNIYVLGETGTGRTTAIHRYLKDKTRNQPTPDDWVYVHNFKTYHQPRAIEFPAGQGSQFKKQMGELVNSLREDLPRAFATEEYGEAVDMVSNRAEIKQNLLMHDLERKARAANFRIIRTAAGPAVAPIADGEVMTAEQYADLSLDEQAQIDKRQQEFEVSLEDVIKRTRQIKIDSVKELDALDRRVARQAITLQVDALIQMYCDHEEVLLYLAEVHDDVLDNLHDFRPNPQKPNHVADLSRYDVNLFVDNSRTEGAPVIVEQNPSYNNLLGRIEYEMRDGYMSTHFDNIKSGALHQANGGYLVMEAIELLGDPYAWEALKRSIKAGEIALQPSNTLDGSRVLAKSIDPEAIPLDIKLILLGGAG